MVAVSANDDLAVNRCSGVHEEKRLEADPTPPGHADEEIDGGGSHATTCVVITCLIQTITVIVDVQRLRRASEAVMGFIVVVAVTTVMTGVK